MIVEVALSNNLITDSLRTGPEDSVCVVIDVIRATSSIATLFGRGANRIMAARDKEQAFMLKEMFEGSILCGEEGGLPPRGFDYGNSPLEFSAMDMAGKTVILKTTNGTVSFARSAGSPCIFSLSLLNFRSTMESVISSARSTGKDILLLCSGEKGRPAYDDCYVAGLAVRFLLQRPVKMEFSDSAKLVLGCALSEKNIKNALLKSSSAAPLKNIGLIEDVSFCSRINEYDLAVNAREMPVSKIKGAELCKNISGKAKISPRGKMTRAQEVKKQVKSGYQDSIFLLAPAGLPGDMECKNL